MTTYLSKEAYDKLKAELHEMKTKGRQKMAQMIQEAREQGDLSENAEYDAAKEAQGLMEAKIAKLESTLANARILDPSQMDTSKAYISSKVKIKNLKLKRDFIYQLVSETEANLKEGKISVKSPVGRALLGKEIGDVVDVEVPVGTMKFEILEISYE